MPRRHRDSPRNLWLLGFLLAGPALAEDQRQLATLPPPEQEVLRLEMLDNLLALNQILALVGADQITEARAVAEQKLGLSSQGRHRDKPFESRPGPHMPPAMHALHGRSPRRQRIHRSGEERRTLAYPGIAAELDRFLHCLPFFLAQPMSGGYGGEPTRGIVGETP